MSSNKGTRRKNRRTAVNLGMIRKGKGGEFYIQIIKEIEKLCMGRLVKK